MKDIAAKRRKQDEADTLTDVAADARELATRLGLWPAPVKYWMVDHDEMNELIAYDGFQDRYPHWRWGMAYDRQQKQSQFLGGKAFEIVNNDRPANAFLQVSNNREDQKAVITHVEAHADFFANNEWFQMFEDGDISAAALLSRHADVIAEYMEDADIGRSEVERFIDSVLSIEDTIDQHRVFTRSMGDDDDETTELDIDAQIAALGLDDAVERQVFNESWKEQFDVTSDGVDAERDVLAFLLDHGMVYDEDSDKAVEMEDWQRDVLQMLRAEAYYFAPQKMTKIMNEGWASYWESIMMARETVADPDEFITYADHMSKVLGGGGGSFNPYQLGLQLWKYVENRANRREVINKLLRVEGVAWHNFHSVVDMDAVYDALQPDDIVVDIANDTVPRLLDACPDERLDADNIQRAADGTIDLDENPWKALSYTGLAERHYSLVRLENRGLLERITEAQLEEEARYILDDELYESVAAAIADVDYTAGWEQMRDVRATHNDATFIDAFLTEEFVEEHNYFAYEYSHETEEYHVSSTDVADIKRQLLLQLTNFGKPSIVACDDNFNNRGELLLAHEYNGVMLDMDQAEETIKRVYELYGRPVNLVTVCKNYEPDNSVIRRRAFLAASEPQNEPVAEEIPRLLRYDGDEIEYSEPSERLADMVYNDNINYDTRPDSWLDS